MGGPPYQVGEGDCELSHFNANSCSDILNKMTNSSPAKAIRELFFGDKAQIIAIVAGRLGRHWWPNYNLLVRAASMENQSVLE